MEKHVDIIEKPEQGEKIVNVTNLYNMNCSTLHVYILDLRVTA